MDIGNLFSGRRLILMKILLSAVMLVLMAGLYPFGIIPSASMHYKPDGTFEWKNAEIVKIGSDNKLLQEYKPQRGTEFESISLIINGKEEDSKGLLKVSLCDSELNVIKSLETDISEIEGGGRKGIPLKTKKLDNGSVYYISVELSGSGSVELFLVDKRAENYFSETYIDGVPCNGSLLAELYTTEYTDKDIGIYVWIIGILFIIFITVPWRKVGYLYLRIITVSGLSVLFLVMSYYQKLYEPIREFPELKKLCFAFVLIAVAVLAMHAYVIIKNMDRKAEKCFLISVLGWGAVYLLLMPPYSYPDEPTHYAQANAYVNRFMGQDVRDENGQIYIRAEELIDVVSFPSAATLADYYDGALVMAAKPGYGTMGIVNGLGLGRVSTICYIPFEIGIYVARVFGLNYAWSFTVSNMLGLMCYAAIVYIAMHLLSVGKWILFLTAQFPMALSTATSITYDLINYSLLTLLFAIFCHLLYDRNQFAWKKLAAFAVIGAVVFPIKYAYFPFALFVLLLPGKKFNYKHAGIVKIIVLVFLLMSVFVDNNVKSFVSGGNGSAQYESMSGQETIDVRQMYHIREGSWLSKEDVIGDKGNFIKYTYNTFYKRLDYYLNGMIGMGIGWGDSLIPDYVYNIWWFLLLFAIIGAREERYIFDRNIRIGTFVICALCFGAIYMAMLLGATPVGYSDCPSVGARYILPLLLPVCMALRGKKIVIPEGVSDELFIWGADLCQIVAMVYMFAGYLDR